MCENQKMSFYRRLCAINSHLSLNQKPKKKKKKKEICLFSVTLPLKCAQHPRVKNVQEIKHFFRLSVSQCEDNLSRQHNLGSKYRLLRGIIIHETAL